MAIKRYSAFPKLWYYRSLTIRRCSVISRTLIRGVLPLCRDAVSIFYSSSPLGQCVCVCEAGFDFFFKKKGKRNRGYRSMQFCICLFEIIIRNVASPPWSGHIYFGLGIHNGFPLFISVDKKTVLTTILYTYSLSLPQTHPHTQQILSCSCNQILLTNEVVKNS